MKFYIYSVYDPEVESFDSRLNLGPLDPQEMAEQYRRADIKMDPKDKAFMEGKKAYCIGEFDDIEGKIEQKRFIEIYRFKGNEKEKESQVQGEVESA